MHVLYCRFLAYITLQGFGDFEDGFMLESPVQESKTTAVNFNFWFRVGTRGIYCRGKKTLLYALVINPRHI